MKRLFFAVISIACTISSNSQDLTEKDFLSQLPRTTDDFQNYQFDYELENLHSHLPSYPLGITSTISSFDGTGIFPIQHVCPVKEIECYQFNKRDGKDILCYAAKAKFATNGQIVEYSGKECYKQQYWYSDKTYSQIDGADLRLIPCLPNPYITMIKPNRNSKGLITKVGNDWVYDYDSYDRVIQIRHIDDKYSYSYEYLNNTKKITDIKIYMSKQICGEVHYKYTNDKITELNGKIYYKGYEGNVEKEFIKTYSYDSNGGVASMTHIEKKPGNSEILHEYTFDNRYDSKGRIASSNVTMNRQSRTGSYRNGLKQPEEFTRTYTYDEKGNWIKIEDGKEHYVIRNIVYNSSAQKGSNDAHVYNKNDKGDSYKKDNTPKFTGEVTNDNVYKAWDLMHRLCDEADASEKDRGIALYKEAYVIYRKLESFPNISNFINIETMKYSQRHIRDGLISRGAELDINMKKDFDELSSFMTGEEIHNALNEAGELCKKAREANNKKEVAEFYKKAYEIYKKIETHPNTPNTFKDPSFIKEFRESVEQKLKKLGVRLDR
jgi:hypothetical protein